MTEMILASTASGAESAAVFTRGDTVSIVTRQCDESVIEAIEEAGASRIVVDCDLTHTAWVAQALGLVNAISPPGFDVVLLLRPHADTDFAELFARAMPGWVATGVTIRSGSVAIHAAEVSEDPGVITTVETVRGAQQLAETFMALADTSAQFPDAEYWPSTVLSRVVQTPRLQSEMEQLKRELDDAKRAASNVPTVRTEATTEGSPTAPAGKSRRSPRWQRILMVVGAAGLSLVIAYVIASATNSGPEGFLGLMTLGVVVFIALDTRRRFVGVNQRLLDASRSLQRQQSRQERTAKTLSDQFAARARGSSEQLATGLQGLRTNQDLALAKADRLQSTLNDANSRLNQLGELKDWSHRLTEAVALHTDSTSVGIDALRGSLQHLPTTGDLGRMIRAELGIVYNQIEGNLRLRDVVDVTGMTPPLRGWAAAPDVIALLVTEMRQLEPRLVLECGSGASTAWLAMAAQSMGLNCRVVALEHDPRYAKATEQLLRDCGVDEVAEVRVAPLVALRRADYDGLWYDPTSVEDLEGIGLVFVDGPPADVGEMSRYPALPVVRSRLAETATVVLDDLVRSDEKTIFEAWKHEYPEAATTILNVEKGAAVLRFTSDDADDGLGS